MIGFLLWLLLLVFCWPLALAALVLYPLVWLLLLPFRLIGITVAGVLALLTALILLAGIAEGTGPRLALSGSVGQRLQVAPQRRAAAIELLESLGSLAQLGQVLYRRLVRSAVGIARRDPQAVDTGITCGELTAQGNQGKSSHYPHHAGKRCATTVQASQNALAAWGFFTRRSQRPQ